MKGINRIRGVIITKASPYMGTCVKTSPRGRERAYMGIENERIAAICR